MTTEERGERIYAVSSDRYSVPESLEFHLQELYGLESKIPENSMGAVEVRMTPDKAMKLEGDRFAVVEM